jgi:AcrR family transcriptional regulator
VLEPREEILRHAASLFSSKGIGATRLTDIAAAVGVTTSAIYYHFENLDSILHALLEYVVQESAAFATAAADRPGSCPDRLRELIGNHIERLTSGPYDLWFVAGLSDEIGRRFPDVTRQANRWRDAVGRLVDEGVRGGEFRPVDRQLAVASLSGLVYGAMLLRHDDGRIDPDAVALMAVKALSR